MSTSRRMLPAALPFAAALLLWGGASTAHANQEHWEEARKASCQELVSAYVDTIKAEQKVVAAIQKSKNDTVATNVLGVATMAVIGVGFFSWNDNASADENLADLRQDLHIITAVAAEKKCVLPATAVTPGAPR